MAMPVRRPEPTFLATDLMVMITLSVVVIGLIIQHENYAKAKKERECNGLSIPHPLRGCRPDQVVYMLDFSLTIRYEFFAKAKLKPRVGSQLYECNFSKYSSGTKNSSGSMPFSTRNSVHCRLLICCSSSITMSV